MHCGEIAESTVHVKCPLIMQEGGREGLGKLDPARMFLVSDGHSRDSICAIVSALGVPSLCQALC